MARLIGGSSHISEMTTLADLFDEPKKEATPRRRASHHVWGSSLPKPEAVEHEKPDFKVGQKYRFRPLQRSCATSVRHKDNEMDRAFSMYFYRTGTLSGGRTLYLFRPFASGGYIESFNETQLWDYEVKPCGK